MDKEGSYRWYRDSSGNSASWQGTLSFNTYINNMINAGSNESGLNATVFDLGTGADFSSIPSSVRVGSIVLGSMPSPSHAVLIVQVNGTDRSNVLYNGHNGNEQEYSIRYQYGDAPLRIISVGSYKVGTTCNHTYSNVPSGGGTDATCNNPGCNFSRIYIDPNILKPVSANTVQTISAYFGYNIYTASYKIYSLNSNGTRNSLLYTSSEVHSTNSISGTYRFTQAGLYEIEFTVEDCSTEENIITNSMRIRVR